MTIVLNFDTSNFQITDKMAFAKSAYPDQTASNGEV